MNQPTPEPEKEIAVGTNSLDCLIVVLEGAEDTTVRPGGPEVRRMLEEFYGPLPSKPPLWPPLSEKSS